MNKMSEVKIEKVVLSAGGIGDKLEKACKLLKIISGRKPIKLKSNKRIPAFNVRPDLETGCKVTLRKDFAILKRLLQAVDNKLKRKQVESNHFSFGIKEYIEIPEMEYQRDIGTQGLNVTISFVRSGKRVKLKKIKKGRYPKKQEVTQEEIIKFMENNYKTEFEGKEK